MPVLVGLVLLTQYLSRCSRLGRGRRDWLRKSEEFFRTLERIGNWRFAKPAPQAKLDFDLCSTTTTFDDHRFAANPTVKMLYIHSQESLAIPEGGTQTSP